MLVPPAELLLQALAHVLEQQRIRIRRDRELVVVVGDAKGTIGVLNLQLAVLEDLAVLVAEGRHDQFELIFGLATGWPPVDVEEARIG